jgi:DNA-binding response OmpR family regulator
VRLLGDAQARPDLILSDISMPGLDGAALIKALRAAPETARIPAILMSGLALPRGLLEAASASLGVGPVFIKGGDLQGLVARVAGLLRPRDERQVVIDPLKRTVRIGGVHLPELPARRFQLLCALLRERRDMSREELLAAAWDGTDNLNVVDVTVLRLRQDLKDLPFLRIETVPAGYRLLIGPYSL